VTGFASRNTFSKELSASLGCISHSGRPNQSRISARWSGVVADGAIRQARRGTRHHKAGQQIGLKVGEILIGRQQMLLPENAHEQETSNPEFTEAEEITLCTKTLSRRLMIPRD